ncbi:NlpC/P60 family protein [Streptomyces sp. NPDC050546]|uniref:C40 family peptidase n=1 Tax=Streptomyces sp. NPDC050546 TaxID=3365628 RepID=UPI0037ABCBE7
MATESETPSPDEVRRYVDSLYDRAESDSGTFNATRAASIPRQRGPAARDGSREDAEPAFGAFARQWFDAARTKLGPTVPASLPDKRLPARPDRAPQAAPSARPAERPAKPLALEAPKASTNGAWELTGGSAQAPTTAALPQLSGRPVAPGAADNPQQDESAWRVDERSAPGNSTAAWPRYEPGAAASSEHGPVPALQPTAALPTGPVPLAAYGTGLPDIPEPATAALAPALPAEPTTTPAPTTQATTAAWEATSTTVTSATYDGSWLSPATPHRTRAERVIAFARAQIDRPCVWGAVGPGSYDAPGLAQAAWRAADVTLPRTTEAQWRAGTQISLADAQVGDLVFFHDDLSHVGICSGEGTMIHAPGPGARIREESVFFAGRSAIKGAIRPA